MPARLIGLRHWRTPYTSFDWKRRGPWLMGGQTRQSTTFVDLRAWTPQPIHVQNEYCVSFDVLPDGRLVVCSMLTGAEESEYAVRVHPRGWPADPNAGSPEVYPMPAGAGSVVAIGDAVVAFDWLIDRNKPPEGRVAYLLERRKFVPARGLPEVTTFDPGQFSHQTHGNGKVSLAPGRDVLVWDGNGYELEGGAFEPRWELAAAHCGALGRWTAVPWGADGFFYLSDGRVMYARWLRDPVPVHPDAENVMSLGPGPGGSVILTHGRNRKSYVARVWYPEDGSYVPIRRTDLGYGPSAITDQFHWSEDTDYFYNGGGTFMLTFPATSLDDLKRVRPRRDGYRLPKP